VLSLLDSTVRRESREARTKAAWPILEERSLAASILSVAVFHCRLDSLFELLDRLGRPDDSGEAAQDDVCPAQRPAEEAFRRRLPCEKA
jgi:hypothetical protein